MHQVSLCCDHEQPVPMKRVLNGFQLDLAATKNFWGIRTFAFVALVNMIFTLAIDCHYGQKQAGLIIAARLLVTCTNICLATILSSLFFRNPRNNAAGLAFNVISFGMLDAFGDGIMGFVLVTLGVRKDFEIYASLTDALYFSPLFFLVTVYVVGIGFRQDQLKLKVTSLLGQIQYLESSTEKLVSHDRNRLGNHVLSVLGPKIAYAKDLIDKSTSSTEAASVLRFLNQSDVRPLASQISLESVLQVSAADTVSSEPAKPQKKYSLSKSLNPISFLGLALALIVFLSIFSEQPLEISKVLVLLLNAGVIALARQILKSRAQVKVGAIWATQVAVLALPLVLAVTGATLSGATSNSLTFGYLLATVSASSLVSGALSINSQRNVFFNEELWSLESSLRAYLTRLRQKQWVARRKVISQVHGQVQGSVVAALTRLANSDDPERIEKAKMDLDRAMAAIQETQETSVDITHSLAELKLAWEGVCEIELTLAKPAVDVCNASSTTAFVANALITEGVVNAVRHGNADRIQVSIDLQPRSTFRILIADNGKLAKKLTAGTGSKLITDLSTDWSLTRIDNRTVLAIRFPVNSEASDV